MQNDSQYDELDFSNASDLVNKRQRYRRRPKKSADLVSRLMARQGYTQTRSNDELKEAWEIAVGPKYTQSTTAGRISRGVLEIQVANSPTINQLSFQKRQLLSAMQQQLPQNKIKDIRFKLGNVAK